MRIRPGAATEGVRRIAFEEIPSTNGHALDLARRGERGPLWVTARRQTQGRGRRGKIWVSEPGNLFATLLLTDPAPAAQAAGLSFVAGLAVHDAVAALGPALRPRLALKWPNDVLIAGAKVAGILLEAERTGAGGLAVAVGIGVNCATHPMGTEFPATSLAACGAAVRAEEVFAALAAAMADRLVQWRGGSDFAAVRADWLACAAGVGEGVRVRLAERQLVGVFEALDGEGRLVLRLPDGRTVTVTAGEVFGLGTAAPNSKDGMAQNASR